MRHISTITVQEGKGLWEVVMPKEFHPFRGYSFKFKSDTKTPERVLFTQGVERLGIYFNGHIWADSDLSPLKIDKEKAFKYLNSINIKIN